MRPLSFAVGAALVASLLGLTGCGCGAAGAPVLASQLDQMGAHGTSSPAPAPSPSGVPSQAQ